MQAESLVANKPTKMESTYDKLGSTDEDLRSVVELEEEISIVIRIKVHPGTHQPRQRRGYQGNTASRYLMKVIKLLA